VSFRVQMELNSLGFVNNPTENNIRIGVKYLLGGNSKRNVFADTYYVNLSRCFGMGNSLRKISRYFKHTMCT